MDYISNHLDSKLHPDTETFAELSPRAFALTLDVIPAIGYVLGWSRSGITFLVDILRCLSDGEDALVIKRAAFGRKLFPGDSVSAAERKISRMTTALKRDQALSGFQAAWIETGTKVVRNGRDDWLPSTYRVCDFYLVLAVIQERALECDICSLPLNERRAKLLTIVEAVCRERDYQHVPARARRSAKSPSVEKWITKDDVEARIGRAMDDLFECGQDWMSLGLRLPDFVKKVLISCEANEIRLREAVKRSKSRKR